MARATRASGERNPKAMRVRSRSFVFTLSTRAFRQSVAERSVDAGAVVTDGAGQLHERGEPAAPGPRQPGVEQRDPLGAFELKHLAELFLSLTGRGLGVATRHRPRRSLAEGLTGGTVESAARGSVATSAETAISLILPVLGWGSGALVGAARSVPRS